MKFQAAFLVLTAAISLSPVNPALADQFKMPEEIGRVEAPRDMNMFQIEPSVLDERYYTTGRAERHQFIGNTLPAGAPIPDTDGPVPVVVVPAQAQPLATPHTVPAKVVPTPIPQSQGKSVVPSQTRGQTVPKTNAT